MTQQAVTKEEIAAALHGREYGNGQTIPGSIAEQAKAAGLLIVYGESDDLMEFRGAFTEEIGAGNHTKALIDAEGIVTRPEETDRMLDDRLCKEVGAFITRRGTAATIEALWGQGGTSWSYHTEIPHATFDIMEEGDIYCRGLVIAVADLPQVLDWQKIAEGRKETISAMSSFLDDVAEALGVAKPSTPVEGVGAVWKVMSAIEDLNAKAGKPRGLCVWTQPTGSDLEESDCYQAECDGSTVTLTPDMDRCYRCGRQIQPVTA